MLTLAIVNYLIEHSSSDGDLTIRSSLSLKTTSSKTKSNHRLTDSAYKHKIN